MNLKMKHDRITEKAVIYFMSGSLEKLSQLTCYKIAGQFNINLSYLSLKFKKDTKISLFDFIELEKMIRVRILLKNRFDLTIEDISQMFGLEKIEQFRARFKKFFLLPPVNIRVCSKTKKLGAFLKKIKNYNMAANKKYGLSVICIVLGAAKGTIGLFGNKK
jgi:AraC-like DNA-binding protein